MKHSLGNRIDSFLRARLPVTAVERDAKLGRKGFRPALEILIFFAVFSVASAAESIPLTLLMLILLFSDGAFTAGLEAILAGEGNATELIEETVTRITEATMLPSLFLTVFAILAAFLYCAKIEKRPLRSLGFRKGQIAAEYGVGLLVGAGLFSLAVALCAVTGSLTVSFAVGGFTAAVPLFFLGFLVQGMSEEVLCRGYLMLSVSRRSSITAAIFWNSLIFALLHLFNPGLNPIAVLNLLLFGVFASVYFLKRGNIWGVAAIHSVWNFMQGNFYGIPVSGMGNLPSVFSSEIEEGFAATLWNGGAFGLEGGLAVTLVLIIATAVMLCLPTKPSEVAPPDPEGTDHGAPPAETN